MLSSRLAPWLGVLGLGAGGGILLNTGESEGGDQFQLAANVPTRKQQVSTLSSSKPSQPFDLLVIGGGATGSGIAVDAATRYSPAPSGPHSITYTPHRDCHILAAPIP